MYRMNGVEKAAKFLHGVCEPKFKIRDVQDKEYRDKAEKQEESFLGCVV
ncbi:hypothetical protein T02_14379 [Trichinella nativa]|uniref:Uncharacterized protein n=1 Tax=Trichinella nativa TaxID=6335 RepID=A0A0V1KJG4_9BILA|nr:hypothetical protein T02_14379 [Trichinella nativa]